MCAHSVGPMAWVPSCDTRGSHLARSNVVARSADCSLVGLSYSLLEKNIPATYKTKHFLQNDPPGLCTMLSPTHNADSRAIISQLFFIENYELQKHLFIALPLLFGCSVPGMRSFLLIFLLASPPKRLASKSSLCLVF